MGKCGVGKSDQCDNCKGSGTVTGAIVKVTITCPDCLGTGKSS